MIPNPRSKKVELPADPYLTSGSIVLERTRYLKQLQSVQTSPDWGGHWQRPAKGARKGLRYDWFVEVELWGKKNRLLERSVVDVGPATLEEINNAEFFWERYEVAVANWLRWGRQYDIAGIVAGGLLSPLPEQYSPKDIKKIVIIRRWRHKDPSGISPRPKRRIKKRKRRVPFSEKHRTFKRGKGIKPPDIGDPRLRKKKRR